VARRLHALGTGYLANLEGLDQPSADSSEIQRL